MIEYGFLSRCKMGLWSAIEETQWNLMVLYLFEDSLRVFYDAIMIQYELYDNSLAWHDIIINSLSCFSDLPIKKRWSFFVKEKSLTSNSFGSWHRSSINDSFLCLLSSKPIVIIYPYPSDHILLSFAVESYNSFRVWSARVEFIEIECIVFDDIDIPYSDEICYRIRRLRKSKDYI